MKVNDYKSLLTEKERLNLLCKLQEVEIVEKAKKIKENIRPLDWITALVSNKILSNFMADSESRGESDPNIKEHSSSPILKSYLIKGMLKFLQ